MKLQTRLYLPDLLNVDPSLSDQELVMLRLGFDFCSDATQLLFLTHLLEKFDSFLNIICWTSDSDNIRSRVGLRELDGNLTNKVLI